MACMVRKDYKLIAKAINNAKMAVLHSGLLDYEDWDCEIIIVENAFISLLTKDNPRFDATQFKKDCGRYTSMESF